MRHGLLLVVMLMLPVAEGKAQVAEEDSLALVALYNATNGPNWVDTTNWLTMSVSQWHGVTVTSSRVTKLNLFANQLSGAIPEELGNLTELTDLALAFNQLTGAIPDALSQLTKLTVLDFDSNLLTGSIPDNLAQLTNLTYLDLHGNQLTGAIPGNLGQLTNLTYLDLGINEFTGNVPAGLETLTNLTFLDLSNTLLTGTLPLGLINLTKLDTFWFNETTLCTPVDEAFQDWLRGITDVRSTGCTNVAAEDADEIPSDFVLGANYPNPFNASTTIRYAVPEAGFIRLIIYDGLGRRVQVLVEEAQVPAWHEAVFDADGLPNGVYFYRLETDSFQASGQMLLVR